MATMHAQPPESGLDVRQSTPIIPRRRSVIDVDEFVETRPVQRRRIDPEIISLIDSDEDEPERGNLVRINVRDDGQPQPPRRSIFSPPPAMRNNSVPPVPLIPAQYAGDAAYPVRPLAGRHAPPTPPAGVVRPIAQPLPFEAVWQRRQRSRQQRQQNQLNQIRQRGVPPFAAPPSHHTPNMGLGGALIAHNQHLTRVERIRNQILSATAFYFANDQRAGDSQQRPPAVVQHFPNPTNQSEEAYRQWYTHNDAPEPGFTFNFAVEETPAAGLSNSVIVIDDNSDEMLESPGAGPSSQPVNNATTSTLLVCVMCLDPLVLGEGGARKVWGLRCGHLLDGKCLDVVSKIEEKPPVASEPSSTRGSGKGKGKAVEPPLKTDNSIRSRLRSRASGSGARCPTPPASSPSVKAAAIDAERQWKCPVEHCRCVHLSVRQGSEWTVWRDGAGMESAKSREGKGVISIFV